MNEPHNRRSHAWGRFLLIWAIFLLLLGIAGCVLLYHYLGIYEVTRPEPVMDAYVADMSLDEMIEQAKQNVPLELTEYEDPLELYSSYLDAVDLTRALNYRINSEQSDSSRIVYDVRSGPSLICNIILTPYGTSPGFGRNYWAVTDVCAAPITDFLPSAMAVVDAVSGMELLLNGKPLDVSSASEKPIDVSDLTKFESEMDSPPSFLEYRIGPLYGEIKLSDAFSNPIPPEGDVVDGIVHFKAFGETQSIHISAPEDLQVYVNDVALSKSEMVSSSPGVWEGLELYTLDASCLTNQYQVDGLYLPPVVTAREKDGTEVTPIASAGNSFTFFHTGDPEPDMLAVAQKFFNAYMDYSAHAFDYTRYINLLGCILPQCDLYQYVFNSQEAMYWASGTQTEYKDLRYDNFHLINDYCFVCTVIYSADMTATNWYEQYSYQLENAYELAFVSTGGQWLAAGMNAITGA